MRFEKIPIVLHAIAAAFLGANYLRVRGCSRRLYQLFAPAACPKLWAALRLPLEQLLTRPGLNAAALSTIVPAFGYRELTADALHQALRRAEPGPAAWLFTRWPDSDVAPWDDFRYVCSRGYGAMAGWIMGRYAARAIDEMSAAQRQIVVHGPLWAACGRGHLQVAQLIAAHFALTREHVMTQDCGVLRAVCASDSLAVAEWVADHFRLRKKDIQIRANHILMMACAEGKLGFVQWLVRRFRLKAADARSRDNWALQVTCVNNHLAVAQWLVEEFSLTADDARSNGNYALTTACAKGHLAVVQWLASRFGLTPATRRWLIKTTKLSSQFETAQWLETDLARWPDSNTGVDTALWL